MGKLSLPQVCLCAVLVAGIAWHSQSPAFAQPTEPYLLDRLHKDLALNDSQGQSWIAFAHAYQLNAKNIERKRIAAAKMLSLTAPQRMDLAIGLSEEDLADLRSRGDALKAFYASLSPTQQKTFDRDTLPPGDAHY